MFFSAKTQNGKNVISPLLCDDKEKGAEFRLRKQAHYFKSIDKADINAYQNDGWEIVRENKSTFRIRKEKPHHRRFEDRIWSLFYKMGFDCLSGKNCSIRFEMNNETTDQKQIDVFACDEQTVIFIECKSSATRGSKSLRNAIAEISDYKEKTRKAISKLFRLSGRPHPKFSWLLATNNIFISGEDATRADANQIRLLSQNQIEYYEQFIKHLGKPGRYQFLGEFLDGQKIPGLEGKKIPAIKGKMAGTEFYSFVASPADLFKICFINHFTLDHPDGKPAYQRMVTASRIRKIEKFIKDEKGYFPTNILLNFKSSPRFDLISNKENTNENIKFGWLTLPSQYRSAWVIDGQHRLFGYSHLSETEQQTGNLFILAFNELSVNDEAELFVKINSEQKSVPRSLLESLMPELKLRDNNPRNIFTALASQVFTKLATDVDSPFFDRFSKHGIPATEYQSLTLSEAIKGLKSASVLGEIRGKSRTDGPFTAQNDEQTVLRTSTILKFYFRALRNSNSSAWEAGKAGYISTNPSIRAHLGVIKEVIAYLSYKQNLNFSLLNTKEVTDHVLKFCQPIFEYFKHAESSEIQEKFSRKFGEGGVKHYRFLLLKILNEKQTDFGPEDFKLWLTQTYSEDFSSIHEQIMTFSEALTNSVINGLRHTHGTEIMSSGDPKYWEIGVKSLRVRKNAYEKQQLDDEANRSKKEAYLDIVDLAEIVKDKDNWPYFEALFKNPMPNERHGQKYYLDWLEKFNGLRKIAAHRNQEKVYSTEQLEFFQWLSEHVISKFESSTEEK